MDLMIRALVALLAGTLIALAVAPGASAKEGVTARIDISDAALDAAPGTKVRVAWKLRSADGRPFGAGGLYVRLESAADGKATIADARGRNGRYRALATVPRGGIGDIKFGLRGWRSAPGPERKRADVFFAIENDPFEESVYTSDLVRASPLLVLWTLGWFVLLGLAVVLVRRRIRRGGRVP